jgi:hypothetical protein
MTAVVNGGCIERHGAAVVWGLASQPLSAETQCGDLGAVWSPGDSAVIAVVDGSGHGGEAAAASLAASTIIGAHAHESPVALMLRCHEGLRGTRGAAITLVSMNLLDRTMTWLGIGNVEAVVYHSAASEAPPPDRVLLRSGVVGYRLPARLQADVIPLRHMDTLIIATDGLRPEFAEDPAIAGDPRAIAARLLAQYGNHRDDGLVLVAKFDQGGTR